MARSSTVHYIAPSAITITPNANNSANDLAVYVARGTKIKVWSSKIAELGYVNAVPQEWTLSGRNRRLAEEDKPYTIYARLSKTDKRNGYLVFAAKVEKPEGWQDRYRYVTKDGMSPIYSSGKGGAIEGSNTYWYIRLGDVSLPEGNERTVTFDTGILGTQQFNTDWATNPDNLPLRIELDCTIGGSSAGDSPYVAWGQEMVLQAKLVEGWADADVDRFDHWEIRRNTGDESGDEQWNATDRSTGYAKSGNISLNHVRGTGDDFNGAVSTSFTIMAMGTPSEDDSSSSDSSSSDSGGLVVIAATTVNVMAETVERYSLELSSGVVTYDPTTDVYSPIEGIKVRVRATDQKGNVFKLTRGQLENAAIAVQYAVADSSEWTTMSFAGTADELAEAVIDIRVFHAQQNVNVRIIKPASDSADPSGASAPAELDRTPIAFVRNGEDSREREYIFLRSEKGITFGEDPSGHLLPALITGGEVNPEAAATGLDTDKQQDGWVPEGWWDEMQGTDTTYHYEYAAYRDWIRTEGEDSDTGDADEHTGGHWGEFSRPRIWSYYAEDAVTYRCRWTLNNVEVYQLKAAYTGAFRGSLPLVATLMKRVGNGTEQQVTASESVIDIDFDGLPAESQPEPYSATNPQFTIGSEDHPEFIPYLSNVALNAIEITFTVGGEEHPFSIPVIREADEDSVKGTIDEYGSTKFLSKISDDIAAGKITFQDIASFLTGLKIGGTGSRYGITGAGNGTFADVIFDSVLKSLDARSGFTDGSGIYMDAVKGLIETDGMNVRGFMRVMELIINRLQLMESDYSFTEGDTADHVDYEDNGQTLLLTMHKDHDTDYTPFYPGDIIYCKVNDLLPSGSPVPDGHTAYRNGSYYTSYMWVKSVDLTNNQMRVGIYPGLKQNGEAMVQGGINFSPAGTALDGKDISEAMLAEYNAHGGEGYDAMLTLTRHGNIGDGINPETGLYDETIYQSQLERQQSWVLSTTDKRLSFFWRVDEPIISDSNYAVCLGILPDLANLPSYRDKSMPSLYVNTLFADNIDEANYPARIVKEDRGPWTDTPTSIYEGESSGTWTPDGSTYTKDGKTYGNYVKTLGQTGVAESYTPGQTISEPYHYRTFTKALWLSFRLSPSWARRSDGELECILLASKTKADLEVSRVWKGNKLWECLVDGTTQEPSLGCTDWQVVGGNAVFEGEIVTSNGRTFRGGNVDTMLRMMVWWGDEDVTDIVFANQDTQITWTRRTGYDSSTEEFVQTSEDLSWTPTVVDTNKIHLQRGDMGSGWMITYRQALFHCEVSFVYGGESVSAPADFIFR